jgi:hypothetical protein
MTEEIAPGVTPRTPEIDEVLRRIGRNLLLFQQIEHLLKHLMGSSRVEGTLASMQASVDRSRLGRNLFDGGGRSLVKPAKRDVRASARQPLISMFIKAL